MKPNSLYLFLLLLQFLMFTELCSQPLTWDYNYSYTGNNDGYFIKVLQTENSKLYLAGYDEYGWCQYSPGFMKIDTNGNKLWSYTYNFPDSYQLITHTLAKLSENSYYSFCFNPLLPVPINNKLNNKQEEITNDCVLLKLNNDGDTIFSKHFENIGWVNDLIVDNGKLLAVGSTNYYEEINGSYFTKTTIMALDTNGTFLWRKEFLTDINSRANSIIQNDHGNYLITGTTTKFFDFFGYIDNPDKMFLLETDTLGNLQSEYFSEIEYSEGKKIIICADGNHAIIGDGLNPTENSIDIILWKFDTTNNLFQTTFSGLPRTDEAYSIKQTHDGGFIICGYIIPLSSPNWSPAFFYSKTDNDGIEEWHINSEEGRNCAYDLLINNNSGYYFAGFGSSARLVKTDLFGNGLITSIDDDLIFSKGNFFEVFPNPGKNNIIIKNTKTDDHFSFSLFDLFGNKIFITGVNSGSLKINTTSIPEGLYFYQISSDNDNNQSGKWIKE